MLSDEWLSRYGLLENFNASVTRTGTRTGTGTGTWTTGVTAIDLCTSCSRAKNRQGDHIYEQIDNLYTVFVQTAERRRRLQRPIRLARALFVLTSSVTSRDTMLFMDV